MNRFIFVMLMSVALSSCAAFKSASIGDDLYTSHSRVEIAARQKAEAEAARAEAEARAAAWEAKLALLEMSLMTLCWQMTIRAHMLAVCMALARLRTRCHRATIPIVIQMLINTPLHTTLHFIILWSLEIRCG